MEPTLKRGIRKAGHQAERVSVTKRSESVGRAGQLSSRLTFSRNDSIAPTAVQDVEKAGVCVNTHTLSKRQNGRA